jgi:hypothetical protein
MRIALFPAVAVAALAFTGVAQADTVISLTHFPHFFESMCVLSVG